MNYWPMSNLSDVAGGADLFGRSSYSFTYDRFCSPNSSINFNKGYLQVPEGVYFRNDFTFTAWIYLKSYQSFSFFDFGNGQSSDNIVLGINQRNIFGKIFNRSSSLVIKSTSKINLNKWYFISFVLSGTTGFIYVNGNQVANGTLNVPNNITRTTNYIGKSNLNAIYDELKIYQVALSPDDIMNEYQINANNGKLNFYFI